MKVVILAGGFGTRISEESQYKPKPMIEIGDKPILWHIMKIYSYYGFNDFIILTGYKSHVIKDYFVNYYQRYSDITVDMLNNSVEIHRMETQPWKVTMLYTGENTQTASRIKKAQKYIDSDFALTYGDGLANININKLIECHKKSKKILTLTAVQPTAKFGILDIEDNRDNIIFEREPLEKLAQNNQLNAYKHASFWYLMDTLKHKNDLTQMWLSQTAPWAIWLDK